MASIAFFSMSGYSITKGMVYNVSIPESYEYSEEAQFSSKALFSTITYSYRAKGDTIWLDELPVNAGEYQVEIKTKQIFGSTKSNVRDFTINPKNIVLDIEDLNITFGNSPVISTNLVDGDYIENIDFSYGDISQTETSVTIESLVIKDSLGNDVSNSYTYEAIELPITFIPREITVSLLDISDIYKGTVLTSEAIEITEGTLLEGQTIEVSSLGSQLNVGNSLNTIVTSTIMSDSVDVTLNYNVSYLDGSLEVTTRPITLETSSDQKIYDDVSLSNLNYSIQEGSLIEGHIINIISHTDITSVGVIDNVLTMEIVDADGTNVTSNYDITYIYGQLEVTLRSVTITSVNDSKVYDETVLSNNNFTITHGSLVRGHLVHVLSEITVTNVAVIDNILTVEINDSEGNVTTSNYEVTILYGQLEITKRPITIQTSSDVFVYDGSLLSNDNYVITEGTTVLGHNTSIVTNTTKRNVGTVDNDILIEVLDSSTQDVSGNYEITYIYGSIEITPKQITIKPKDSTKIYDDIELTENEVEFVDSNIVTGHDITITTSGSQLNAGSSNNAITTVLISDQGFDVSNNYSISYQEGSLEVTKRQMTFKLVDVEKVYDGFSLSSTELIIVSGELVEGHTITGITSISIVLTDVGTVLNRLHEVNIGTFPVDKSNNYELIYQDGQLEVTPRPITIKPVDRLIIYNGIEFTSTDVESIGILDVLTGHVITITTNGSQLNVGTSINEISTAEVSIDGVDMTSNYSIIYAPGNLEVRPRPITIKPVDATKVYDGIALESELVEVLDVDLNLLLVDGHVLSTSTSGTQLNVGISLNNVVDTIIMDEGIDVTSNYFITKQTGNLEVTPRPISIKAIDANKVYDGITLTSSTAEITSGTAISGHVISITTSGTQLNVGSSSNSITDTIIMSDGVEVTDNYEVTVSNGILVVTPLPISIKAINVIDIYNGENLTSNLAQITSGSIVEGHVISISTLGTQLNVGTSFTHISSTVIMDGVFDVTDNYAITYEVGTLEVTPRPITIQPLNVVKVYDGIALTSTEVEVTTGTVVGSQIVTLTTTGSQLPVGSSVNSINSVVIKDGLIDVTYNYTITQLDGGLEVTHRPITIQTDNETRIYDATALINTNYTIAIGSLAPGQVVDIISNPEITNVGFIVNNLGVEILDSSDVNQISNYDVTYIYGELEVTPRPITIQTASETKIYSGTALSNLNYTIPIGSVAIGQTINIISNPDITNIGFIDNDLSIEVLDAFSVNQINNYDVSYIYGELEVTPRPITIETASESKVYDGVTLSNLIYTIIEGSLAPEQSIHITSNPEIINVSVVQNNLSIEIQDSLSVDQINNYIVTFVYGDLEIEPRPITIETANDIKVYDGLVLSNLNYILGGSVAPRQLIQVTSTPTITNVGVLDNEIGFEILDSFGSDKISNYVITYIIGELEVTPRIITIETASENKVYDGIELVNLNYTLTGSLAPVQNIRINSSTVIIDVGVIANELSIEIYDSENIDQISNYEITYIYGDLEVTPRPITIQTGSDSKVYDGEVLSNQNYIITTGSLAWEQVIAIIGNAEITNVGLIDNQIDFEILDGMDVNQISNYDITYIFGVLQITKRAITVHVIDVSEVYDGEQLTSNVVESVEALDLIAGHLVSAITSGSQLNVGNSINPIESVQIMDGENDVTSNYDVTHQDGLLEVTPRPITIRSDNDSKIYDSTPLSNLNYEVTGGSLAPGEIINVVNNNELTIVDVIDNLLIMDIFTADAEIATANYLITYEYGFLEVTPRTVIISTSSAIKDYDGTPLTNNEWELSSGSILVNQQLTVTVTGSITEVGKAFNTFTYEILDSELNDVSMYYVVVDNAGVLEIERLEILLVIKTGSDSKTYDGLPLTNTEWIITEGELLVNHTLEITMTGTITEVGSTGNDFTYIIKDEFDVDVTSYYFVQSTVGTLTVFAADENGASSESTSDISDEGEFDTLQDSTGVVLEVYSDIDDTVYLRDKSYGDYLKTGWDAPILYVSPFGYTPFKFPALVNNDIELSYQLQVKAIRSGLSYYVPYYSMNGFYDNTNDVYVNHAYGAEYTVDYIPTSSLNYETLTLEDPQQIANELLYRQFVYDTYLQLPRETEDALLEIAQANGLDSSNPSIITDIQNYILNVAVYNKAYNPIPENVDKALYFLEVSHEGICQHFATAGVVMYRAMGIPARYVTGFVATSIANEWSEVTTDNAHAWVEIYIDGFGWVPVEVTASIEGSGSGIDGTGTGTGTGTGDGEDGTGDGTGTGDGGSGSGSEILTEINIISGNASKQYDGIELTKSSYYHTGTLASGHILTVDVTGSILLVGETSNIFTYTIMDYLGNDVSSLYNISTNYGLLVVTPHNDLEILEFQVYDLTTVYNGEVVQHGSSDYWMPSNNLPSNYTVTFNIIGEIIDVGWLETYIDNTSIVVLDENNMDVTNEYNIICYPGSIEVLQRSITISSFSTQKTYDGLPLTSDIFYFAQGSLAEGDSIVVDIIGSITEVGTASNVISNIVITNSNGVDVTSNYDIDKEEGQLIVEPE